MTTIDQNHNVRHLLELADAIRPMPLSVRRLAGAIADEYGQLADVAGIVREDPMLVTTLLREANSAASAPLSRIVTIEATITRLGLARVLAVASLSVFGPEADAPLRAYRLPAGALVAHALRTSYVAEAAYSLLAGRADPGVVTAALLHDLGKLVLDVVLEPHCFDWARETGTLITTVERDLVTVDHAELGALILESWGVPDSIATAVRHHHTPFATAEIGPRVVALADRVSHHLYGDTAVHTGDEDVLGPLLADLGLARDDMIERSRSLLARAGLGTEG